jgi:uncharacterized protein (TIGR02231 family)
MRAFALFALLLPGPVLADQILAASKITAVTVYPQGAEITRDVTFTAPAGAHDLLITDLPAETEPQLIRLTGADGLGLGAFSLRTDRLPPRDAAISPALAAAKAEVESWEIKERAALSAIEAVQARVAAAEAQAAFVAGVRAEGETLTPEAVKNLAGMIGAEVLAAKQAALAAKADLPAAEKGLKDMQEGLAKARAAEEAALQGDADYAALSVAVTAASEGAQSLTVTHYVGSAKWQPVYDMMLTRKGGNALTIKRGVLVSQYTGEDWAGVALTLSTAQPSAQSAPSPLWPELRQIVDPAAEAYARTTADAAMPEEAMSAAPVVAAMTGIEGDVVVYRYPEPVDVATGVENLRLTLDELQMTPKVEARAVPRADSTAFVLAQVTNETGEVLLPGEAFLMREGVLVGSQYLDTMAPGAKLDIGFGAIEGLTLRRDMPVRAEGDRGILSSSTQIEETAVLKVENHTDEAWPVRLMDQVPFSEQEDLEISFEAGPAPSEIDVDGQRGILAWDFEIAAGEVKEVTLTHVLSWPEGMDLR